MTDTDRELLARAARACDCGVRWEVDMTADLSSAVIAMRAANEIADLRSILEDLAKAVIDKNEAEALELAQIALDGLKKMREKEG